MIRYTSPLIPLAAAVAISGAPAPADEVYTTVGNGLTTQSAIDRCDTASVAKYPSCITDSQALARYGPETQTTESAPIVVGQTLVEKVIPLGDPAVYGLPEAPDGSRYGVVGNDIVTLDIDTRLITAIEYNAIGS